jgi:hypothetical protein
MSADDFGFAGPPFKPEEALQRLRRDLRELGLGERAGVFERRGVALARARIDGGRIVAALVERPSRTSPKWREQAIGTSAELRDFSTEVKRALQQWGDRDD